MLAEVTDRRYLATWPAQVLRRDWVEAVALQVRSRVVARPDPRLFSQFDAISGPMRKDVRSLNLPTLLSPMPPPLLPLCVPSTIRLENCTSTLLSTTCRRRIAN